MVINCLGVVYYDRFLAKDNPYKMLDMELSEALPLMLATVLFTTKSSVYILCWLSLATIPVVVHKAQTVLGRK